jgi:ABC-2 type transport system ATP-binding protein
VLGPRPKSIHASTIGGMGLDEWPYRRLARRGDNRHMITLENLTKRYGGRAVVDNVSFSVEPGAVTGFLGANGAGKSTTLRTIVGLTQPDEGRALLLGNPYSQLPNPGRQIGVLLDAAAQHGGRTGREALAVSAQTMGVDMRRVTDLLDLVGLEASAARKRVRHYSLGMRQRLGIAQALLGDPEILILDEPANGLDPSGMRWMRELLRDFADRGGTVLLSSHLLREVEALADRLVIINLGRIVAQGSTAELLATGGSLVAAEDERSLEAALGAARIPARPAPDGGFFVDAAPEDVGRVALAAGVALSRLGRFEGAGIEQLFFDVTKRGSEDLATPDAVEAH